MNHNTPHQPIRADSYLRSIYSSEEFNRTLGQGNFSTLPFDEQHKLRSRAIGKAANFLTQQHTKDSYVTPEGTLYNLIGGLESFYRAKSELNRMNELEEYGHTYTRDAIRAHKEKIIHFNNSLKDVIDTHPSMNVQELLRFTGASFEHLHGSEHLDDFMHELSLSVTGIQHELLAEQVIGAINDKTISYERADTEGDLHGADLYVTIGGVTIPVDIKASNIAVRYSIAKHGKTTQLWSGVPQSEVGGRFRLTHEEAQKYAVGMHERLLALARDQAAANRKVS